MINFFRNIQKEKVKTGLYMERKAWIDGLRGLAMIVVVYGHCLLDHDKCEASIFYVFAYPFNVILFFAISGFLFKTRDGDTYYFFKNLFLRLVIPWMVLGLFPYYNIMQKLPLLLSGKALWFMPTLIFAEIIWFYIHKYSKSSIQIVLLGIFSAIFGMIMYNRGLLNYGMINRALTLQYIFVIGYLVKQYEGEVKQIFRLKYMLPVVMLYVSGGGYYLCYYPCEFYDAHFNRYLFIPLTFGLILTGLIIAFSTFMNLKRIPMSLVYIGQNTLFIYIFSGFFQRLVIKLLDFMSIESIMPFPFVAILQAASAIGACCGICAIINKYCPWVVGIYKKK